MKKIICLLKGHKLKFKLVNLEGHKVWRCERCEKTVQGKYVGRNGQK